MERTFSADHGEQVARMAANQSSNLLKVNQFAKDLNMKTKDMTAILEQKGISVKTQKPLEPAEFDVLFEALTKENQITNIEDYLDGVTYIPSKKKAAEKAEPKPEVVAEAPVAAKPEVVAEKKAEEKKAEPAAEVKPQVKPEPKVEQKPAPKQEQKTAPMPAPKTAQKHTASKPH